MKYKDFEILLKKASLNKKEFSNLSKTAYQTVMNWSRIDKAPDWVISWLENYIKSSKFDKVKKIFFDEVDIENLKSNDA